MIKFKFISFLLVLLILSSCVEKKTHFINDAKEREKILSDYKNRKAAINNDSLFEVTELELNDEEKEAFAFLMAYMPIGDITDFGADFFAKQIRQTLNQQKQLNWKDSIPEYIFRHYVLPVRTNNESLDSFRTEYGDVIFDRVINLSLKDAALEVNNW